MDLFYTFQLNDEFGGFTLRAKKRSFFDIWNIYIFKNSEAKCTILNCLHRVKPASSKGFGSNIHWFIRVHLFKFTLCLSLPSGRWELLQTSSIIYLLPDKSSSQYSVKMQQSNQRKNEFKMKYIYRLEDNKQLQILLVW